jgi:ribosomal-protein-alanine N-acetyltransferase
VTPIIETERLTLREWTPEDAPALFALASDAEVMRYVDDGRPWVDPARARESVGRIAERWRVNGYGRWAVVEKDGGRVVGSCGFGPLAETGEIDFGYILARDRWGRGYATEAARAALRCGFERLGFREVVGNAVPENTPSRRVLEKLGFVYRGPRTYNAEEGEFASYVLKRGDFDARGEADGHAPAEF